MKIQISSRFDLAAYPSNNSVNLIAIDNVNFDNQEFSMDYNGLDDMIILLTAIRNARRLTEHDTNRLWKDVQGGGGIYVQDGDGPDPNGLFVLRCVYGDGDRIRVGYVLRVSLQGMMQLEKYPKDTPVSERKE